MDMQAFLIRHLSYPLWMMRDGDKDVLKYQDYFRYIDRLTPGDLEKSQQGKLRKILSHAYEHTKYYHRLFDQVGFSPSRMQEKEEIRKILKDNVRQ